MKTCKLFLKTVGDMQLRTLGHAFFRTVIRSLCVCDRTPGKKRLMEQITPTSDIIISGHMCISAYLEVSELSAKFQKVENKFSQTCHSIS